MGSREPSQPSMNGGPDTSWTVTGLRLRPGRREQVEDTLGRTADLLDQEGPAAVEDSHTACSALAMAWQAVTDKLTEGEVPPEDLAVLVDLLCQIRSAEEGVRDDQVARRSAAGRVVREALGDLRDVRTVDELVRLAPGAAATVGFDRVMLSRIEESTWVPERMYMMRDERWGDEILQAGREQLRTLDGTLLETQIVRRRRPLVVNDVDRPNLHRALVDTAQTRSYVAAPIVGWGQVIGFLHADCYHQRRLLDDVDRDLLWAFCDGLGHLMTRTAAISAVDTLRSELDRLTAGISLFGAPAGGWPAWSHRADLPSEAQRVSTNWVREVQGDGPDDVEGALTRREVEVMRLMGAGHTNAQIARRLVISEGTVKSHVKHILRKMRAANRAEAVSRWLREEHARQGNSVRREPTAQMGA